jgi:DinB superfamily
MTFTPPPSPHPVEDASGYQRHLLGLLGDDDPADVQAASPAAWRALIAEAGDAVAQRPGVEEWSVLECLGHAFDAEIVSSARYRWILAHDEPPLAGYDQDLWVDRQRHEEDDPEMLAAALGALRAANVALWSRSSAKERARVGHHAERGPESYDLTFRLLAGHDRFHLAQAGRALEALGG